MSGHSKWANIRIRKGAQDARRGKIYTRHARLIEMAARTGGGDPVSNNTLKNAIENAKIDSVPNANIERAIKKGTGELKGEAMAEVLYAAMGPGGAACLIECLTDNRNRTINNVRSKIEKHGGRWTELGSVQWMFARKGVVIAKKTQWNDDLELRLIDAGAEDIDTSGETIDVITDPVCWMSVRDLLKSAGNEILTAGLGYISNQKAVMTDKDTAEKFQTFIDIIEEDDDVSEVHTNA
ncbi:YebC/PmpR family DNA-binding transcriptional regulator [Candidatus Peribacteria bacterium]|nr:YebC/PmpR family DNA-binding transcriptional regulator [Candidatus Peribacteria bacterium]